MPNTESLKFIYKAIVWTLRTDSCMDPSSLSALAIIYNKGLAGLIMKYLDTEQLIIWKMGTQSWLQGLLNIRT